MGMWLDILVDGMGHAVSWLQSVEVFDGVSIWSFILIYPTSTWGDCYR